MQIKQRDKRRGAQFKAASDHKVVPCRIPFFHAFRIMPSNCSSVEETKHFSQPDVQLFVWVSLPPIAAWLTSERFLTLMAKTPAICFCDVHVF